MVWMLTYPIVGLNGELFPAQETETIYRRDDSFTNTFREKNQVNNLVESRIGD